MKTMEKIKVSVLTWKGGKDPTFYVGSSHTGTATLTNVTNQALTITTELFLDVSKVASSGMSSAFSIPAGGSQTVNYVVPMPSAAGGPYNVYLGVWTGSTLLTLYQGTAQVTISLTPVAVSTTSLPGGYVGLSYSQTLAATGGSGSYTWSVSSGSLPAGLTLSGGIISGTPTTAGSYTFTVSVTDGNTTATQSLSITISLAITVGTITWA